MKTEDRVVKVTEFIQAPDYDRNHERYGCEDYTCECCGRKLNPKTMKQVQLLTSGEWTDETCEVETDFKGDKYEAEGQGFFYVGPSCYREIMKQIAKSQETRLVSVITEY